MVMSHLGDPRNAFLLYFPVAYCLNRHTGMTVLWLSCLSEWINAILKWLMHGERPYWWVYQSGFYSNNQTVVEQFPLTCETGPGSPSGHAMVTSSVIYCLLTAVLQLCKPRQCLCILLWSGFVLFMSAACISRCYIATHFPQQVLLGTLVGILLTKLFSTVSIDKFHLIHYAAVSFIIPSSCLALFFGLKLLDLDPQWSISMATRWCARQEWVHLDTTPFNAVYRDAGAILGFGVFLSVSRWLPDVKEPSQCLRMVHIVLSLVVCQVVENIKPAQVDPIFYYFFTFAKFFLISMLIGLITSLCGKYQEDSVKRKRHNIKSKQI